MSLIQVSENEYRTINGAKYTPLNGCIYLSWNQFGHYNSSIAICPTNSFYLQMRENLWQHRITFPPFPQIEESTTPGIQDIQL